MSGNQTLNCADLESRTSFGSYISQIRYATGNDFSLVEFCKAQVCTAIWGNGNTDISGIGMITGYFIEVCLGIALCTALLIICRRHPPADEVEHARGRLFASAFATFCETGLYFAFAIQIAALIVLARFDFEISAANLGSNTVQITWAVSQLVLLPIILPISMSHVLRESSRNPFMSRDPSIPRFMLFAIVWLLNFFPFLSMMIGTFQPSPIGKKSSGAVVTDEEWITIWEVCHAGITPISVTEYGFLKAFNIAGSLFLSLFAIVRIFWQIFVWEMPKKANVVRRKLVSKWSFRTGASAVLLVCVTLLCAAQLWAVWRLQKMQRDISNVTDSGDTDNQWGFGQITAVVVFLPVVVETVTAFVWVKSNNKEMALKSYRPVGEKDPNEYIIR